MHDQVAEEHGVSLIPRTLNIRFAGALGDQRLKGPTRSTQGLPWRGATSEQK